MNKYLITLFILVLSSGFSQEKPEDSKRLLGSKELPLELNLLVQTLQDTNVSKEDLYRAIKNIDSYARLMTKEDIFLIGKIEIYKSLLKSNEQKSKATIDGEALNLLKTGLKKAKDPFVKWFLQALLHDCESLLSSASYKEYILQKSNGRLEKLELKKIDRKIQLLYRWISKLNPDSADFENSLKAELAPALNESLKNIEASFYLMAQNSTVGHIQLVDRLADMKFFSLALIKQTKKPAKKEKSVDEILAPIITDESAPSEATLPEPSKENWLNDDNAPANLKNLPKPSDDADWLEDI